MTGPFDDPNPGNVPLDQAPLVRVLAQVQFPPFSQFLVDDAQIARRLGSDLADYYPLFEEGYDTTLTLSPEGMPTGTTQTKIWRLRSADNDWQVSLAQNFLSLDTGAYLRRSDFAERFQTVWSAFRAIAPPPRIQRVGIRYVNRVTDTGLLRRLPELLRQEVAGVVGQPAGSGRLVRAINEAEYEFPQGEAFLARWGLLPARVTLDPSIAPADSPSWLLDVDSSRVWPNGASDVREVGEISSDLALRCYQFFRWSVHSEFLDVHGGTSK